MTAAADRTTRTLNGAPLLWAEAGGLVHLCEMAEIHPGIRVVWTLCGRDAPAGQAYTREGEVPTCPACVA
jgi:hypothetical protein